MTVSEQKHVDKTNVRLFKARLVAKDFFQREGMDYLETFASAIIFEVLIVLVGKLALDGRHVQHVDISTAFL